MSSVQWEQIDKDQFNVFIRDLSLHSNTNLKHMIEDLDHTKTIQPDKKHKKQKKQIIKKKDLIIQENEKNKQKLLIKNDERKLQFLLESIGTNDPYQSIVNLKTTEIQNQFKLHLLKYFWKHKKKNLHHIFILYYHMKDDFKNDKIISKIQHTLTKYDCKSYMLEHLGHLLPPLNFWNQTSKKLDPWQIDAVQSIRQKQSCLIKAPTSSGKTFVAMATGILFKKILYVCPAKPVAYQVGANYIKMGYKVCYLLENHTVSHEANTNIYVGTPDMIETYLYKIGTSFDYAVFDEIHNLNEYDMGLSYENIIKLTSCNFLALSATIDNLSFLKSIFQRYHPSKKIHEIIYEKRFINQQRWIYNKKQITPIHPISCLDTNRFDDFQYISFTPKDCIRLYDKLDELFEDNESINDLIEKYSPDKIFPEDKLLTLDDSKQYETKLKELVQIISQQYPLQINELIQSFKIEQHIISDDEMLDELLSLFTEAKQKDLFPMIYFHTKQETIFHLFTQLDRFLYQKETEEYPFHHHILNKKKDLFDKYKNEREIFDNKIKITTKNAVFEKQDKLKDFDKKQKDQFIASVNGYLDILYPKCETEKQKRNLKKEQKEFNEFPSFTSPDIHVKHKDFCFTAIQPMSGSDIRQIKKELKKACKLTIDYESPLFQLLKRGIGIYIEAMPDKYNWILQKLMSEKKLGIILASKILCLGIDLPIRTVALSGYQNPSYSTSDYLQMSGRAGRRGHDNQGNIIFHNVPNYLSLMKNTLPEINGSLKSINPSYQILNTLNRNINLDNLFITPIHADKAITPIHTIQCNSRFHILLWYLKDYPTSLSFIRQFTTIEKQLFIDDSPNQYLFTLLDLQLFQFDDPTVYQDFKNHKLSSPMNYYRFKKIGNVLRDICNSLSKTYFSITIKTSLSIFQQCQSLILKYYHFES